MKPGEAIEAASNCTHAAGGLLVLMVVRRKFRKADLVDALAKLREAVTLLEGLVGDSEDGQGH